MDRSSDLSEAMQPACQPYQACQMGPFNEHYRYRNPTPGH